MKKLSKVICLVLSALMLLSLAACGERVTPKVSPLRAVPLSTPSRSPSPP